MRPFAIARHVLAGLVLLSCKGSESSGPGASLGLSLSSNNATLTIGSAGTQITVTVSRSGNVPSPVELTLTSAPAGVAGSFQPATLTGAATTSTLTLQPTGSAAAGQGTIQIAARAGAISASATINTTLQPAPDFTLTLDSSAVTIPISGSATVGVRVTRTSTLTGDIDLGIQGLPNDVSATFAPATLSPNTTSATLTLAPGAFVASGTHTLTIFGQATGVALRQRPLAVNVTQNGRIGVRSTPRTIMVVSGTSTTATIKVTRTAPFAGPVTLVTPTLGSLAFQLSRTVIPATDSTAVLTVTAPPNLQAFTLGTPLVATGLGAPGAADTINVAVVAAPTLFTMLPVGVDSVLVAAGSNQRQVFRVFRGPTFTAPLAITAIDPPVGMQVRFLPASGVMDSTTAEVTVAPSVAPGRYIVNYFADGGGNATLGASMKIRVLPVGSGRIGSSRGAGVTP